MVVNVSSKNKRVLRHTDGGFTEPGQMMEWLRQQVDWECGGTGEDIHTRPTDPAPDQHSSTIPCDPPTESIVP